MFNKVKVSDALIGLVGFENPANQLYAVVDVDNQVARSGRFATDNSFCKIEYLKDTQDYIDATDEDFNTYLQKVQKRSVTDVVDSLLINADYIDRQVLYQFKNNKVTTEVLPAGFVGYKIEKSPEKNVAFEITRCFFEFQGTGNIELLLFNTAIKEPIERKVVSISSGMLIEPLNWRVDNSDDYFQGDWYIGYLTDGLTVLPYKRDYENAAIMSVIAGMCFTPISVTGHNVDELFDFSIVDNASECWGLNFDVVVFNDYTDLIIQHEAIFAPAIQLQMQINCIRDYVASSRSNRNQLLSVDQLNFTIANLEGVEGTITGLIPTLRKELTMLRKQLDRLYKGMFATGFELNTLR